MTSFALFGATLAGLVRRLRLGLLLHATRSDRGTPVTPLSLTIPARKSATTCFSAAFSASRRSVRASRSPRDSSERGIFSGTDMLGTNRVRYEQGQPRSSSYLPGFLPQVLTGGGERVLLFLFTPTWRTDFYSACEALTTVC